jgi:hypothetical protein
MGLLALVLIFIGIIIRFSYQVFLSVVFFLSFKASVAYYLLQDERSFSRLCVAVVAIGFLAVSDLKEMASLWSPWWEQVKSRVKLARRMRIAQQKVEAGIEKQDLADRIAGLTWFIGKHVLRSLAIIGLALHMYALWCVCAGRTETLPEIVWGLIVGSLLVTIVLMMIESIRWIINRRDRT